MEDRHVVVRNHRWHHSGHRGSIVVVLDGHGQQTGRGYAVAEYASKRVADVIIQAVDTAMRGTHGSWLAQQSVIEQSIVRAIKQFDQLIHSDPSVSADAFLNGTTLTALLIDNDARQAILVGVGDSALIGVGRDTRATPCGTLMLPLHTTKSTENPYTITHYTGAEGKRHRVGLNVVRTLGDHVFKAEFRSDLFISAIDNTAVVDVISLDQRHPTSTGSSMTIDTFLVASDGLLDSLNAQIGGRQHKTPEVQVTALDFIAEVILLQPSATLQTPITFASPAERVRLLVESAARIEGADNVTVVAVHV
jgi:serine/threonine protein phosphatase PrpC